MNNIKPKLIALDVDGTIMDKNYRISTRVKNSITKAIENDIYVVVATGRMYSATVPIGIELGLKTPLVVYQGSLIREFYKSDEILLHHHIDTELSYELLNDLRKEDIQINVYYDDKLYAEKSSPMLEEYAGRRSIPYYIVKSFEDMKNFNPTKILAMDPDIEKIDRLKNKFKQNYFERLNITKSTDYYCEFVDKNCSKAQAILFLAEKWGIKKDEILSIGDQDNDKEMLQASRLGVAMGNGHDSLKEIADYVTDTVENDGAALVIERFAL